MKKVIAGLALVGGLYLTIRMPATNDSLILANEYNLPLAIVNAQVSPETNIIYWWTAWITGTETNRMYWLKSSFDNGSNWNNKVNFWGAPEGSNYVKVYMAPVSPFSVAEIFRVVSSSQ